MVMLRIMTLAAATLVLGCSIPSAQTAREQAHELKEVKNAGVSFSYSAKDFAEVKIEKVPRETALDGGDGIDEGISPEHVCFNLKDQRPLPALEQGPRYFYPSDSFICAVPLEDASVKDFARAYPNLDAFATELHKLLRERPASLNHNRDIPDFPPNNASPSILSRFPLRLGDLVSHPVFKRNAAQPGQQRGTHSELSGADAGREVLRCGPAGDYPSVITKRH